MAANRNSKPGARGIPPALALLSAAMLAGCFGGGDEAASRSSNDPARAALVSPTLDGKGAVQSELIGELEARQSVLPAGSTYAKVAASVLEAGAGAAEAELRVARLKARAKSKNWLPSIGPNVSLNSLGSLAASLVLDQAILDNGRRKAERAYSAADVEVAAVELAVDLNQRVYDGLKHYVEAQRATELAAISEKALVKMRDFDRIMKIRVEGGISDGSDYRIIAQKVAETEATLSDERQAATTGWAELDAMSMGDLKGLSGLSTLPADAGAPDPLSVLLARGQASRTKAEIKVARAGLLPGFGARVAIGKDGSTDSALVMDGEGLGFGHKDNMKALEEAEEVAYRRVDEADEAASRRVVALEREIESLTAQQAQQAKVLKQMEMNLDLFTEQYRAGGRTLLELVDQFQSLVRMQRDQASLKYQIAAARLDIARERGVLVNGKSM